MTRSLTLTAERLAPLTTDELRVVNGGDASGVTCNPPSRLAYSLCYCHTGYCTLDC